MAKLPVPQGATRRAYSRAARQARRRWLATKLMGQQPRRAEPREGRASREQLGTCFPAHGNYRSPREGSVRACLAQGWVGGWGGPTSFTLVLPALDRTQAPQSSFHLPLLWPGAHSWAGRPW